MPKHVQQHARNLVVMIAAGGAMDDVMEMAKAFGVRKIHVEQLGVPEDEQAARRWLIECLSAKAPEAVEG